jgi:hypothetical protein
MEDDNRIGALRGREVDEVITTVPESQVLHEENESRVFD